MDVAEFLSYQPEKPGLKRVPNEDENLQKKESNSSAGKESTEQILAKRRKVEETDLDEQDVASTAMDEAKLKRMILNFEKSLLRNQEMRIKFIDAPEKFMESEIRLNETIQEMHVVAATPEHYPILVELRSVDALLQLLSHQNTDIAVAAVDLLEELTEPDNLADAPNETESFVQKLLEGQLCGLLVSNMDRLDETIKEESDGIHSSLAVMENLLEARPDNSTVFANQGLLPWLLKRLSKKGYHQNKLYASELLSILLQNQNEANCKALGEMDGIDILLQQLAVFKRHDPAGPEELELMENLFSCLCAALLLAANKQRFLQGEGLQLMNLMLREKKQARHSAVKVLNYALTGPDGSDNCAKFVEILGLRSIFPMFMRPPQPAAASGKKSRRGARAAMLQLEEHLVSVLGALLRHCTGSTKQRVLSKFVERDHEKADRLLELHFNYNDRLRAADQRLARDPLQRQLMKEQPEAAEEELFLQRLEAGLFTLQQVDSLIVQVCVEGAPSVRKRVHQLLAMRRGRPRDVTEHVRELAENMGSGDTSGDSEALEAEKNRLLHLVNKYLALISESDDSHQSQQHSGKDSESAGGRGLEDLD